MRAKTAMTTDLSQMTATELLAGYRAKRWSPAEAVEAAFRRIETCDGVVNAFCHLDKSAALAAAKQSEQRWQRGEPKGLVDGVPTTIKDLTVVKGWPTGRGSKLSDLSQTAKEDSPAVARLREQGAVLIGKTTTPEFGWKGVTDSPLTGITRNPWNPLQTPGGSSGGAAVAASLGMGALHTGTDGAGSVRIPSAFTGCFGLKPSYGRVPLYPASLMGTLAVLGPMTRSVADAALMMTVMAVPDPRDATAERGPAPDCRVGLDGGVAGLRIAYSPRLGKHVNKVHPEIDAAVKSCAHDFEALGAHVVAADPDLPDDVADVLTTLWSAGSAAILDGYGAGAGSQCDPGFLRMVERGRTVSGADFVRAMVRRAAMNDAMIRFHASFDLLLTPTMPLPALEAGRDTPAAGDWGKNWLDWTPFTYPFNLTQQPAASCPAGFTQAGLPIGLQIVGPLGSDALVLRACRAFEGVRPFRMCDQIRQRP
jgi:aspartyl-tRNA(Asn)/glutamyl-tRNA(Gln) amidotransferase subunit A